MRFSPQRIPGAFLIDLEKAEDARGFFARAFCSEEMAAHGLAASMPQCNVSVNRARGTLRGLHLQAEPHAEAKLIRVVRGSLYDVVLDLRPLSPAYLAWQAFELRAGDYRMLYVPEGCAHGFQTLEDDTEVFYQMSESFHPECARGYRFDDPAFAITWPETPGAERVVSPKDLAYPPWTGP